MMKSTVGSENVAIYGVATAVPETSYSQEFTSQFFQHLNAYSDKQKRFLRLLYRNTGIDERYSVIEDYRKEPADYQFFPKNDQLMPEPGLEARNDMYIRESNRLSERSVRDLFASDPGITPEEITHLITVSCTGFSAPGFDFHLVKALGLSLSVHRYHIGFMGCYAAFPALKLARDICRADSTARVLISIVELCSLHIQQKTDSDFMIANALFADGAAAAVVAQFSLKNGARPRSGSAPRNRSLLLLENFISRIIPGSETDMAWKIGQNAFDMRLSSYVPEIIGTNIASVVDDLLKPTGSTRDAINIWAIHPGGRAILDRSHRSLGLPMDSLHHSYDILRRYGNMSSATIFFVLKSILDGDESGMCFACAFGPGLTVEAGLLRKTG